MHNLAAETLVVSTIVPALVGNHAKKPVSLAIHDSTHLQFFWEGDFGAIFARG